jgi:hypothetical protein
MSYSSGVVSQVTSLRPVGWEDTLDVIGSVTCYLVIVGSHDTMSSS